jgi:hypothetical protein
MACYEASGDVLLIGYVFVERTAHPNHREAAIPVLHFEKIAN